MNNIFSHWSHLFILFQMCFIMGITAGVIYNSLRVDRFLKWHILLVASGFNSVTAFVAYRIIHPNVEFNLFELIWIAVTYLVLDVALIALLIKRKHSNENHSV